MSGTQIASVTMASWVQHNSQTSSTVVISPTGTLRASQCSRNPPQALSPAGLCNEGVLVELKIPDDASTQQTPSNTQPEQPRHVRWEEGTFNNEFAGKKKSKSERENEKTEKKNCSEC